MDVDGPCAQDIDALRKQARDIYKALNTSVAKASLQELPRYRTAKRVIIGTAATAQSILGDDPAWGMLLEPPAWHALQVPGEGEDGEVDNRINIVLPDAPNTLSAMWTDLRPRIRVTLLLRHMKAHEKGTQKVEDEAERLEGCAQVLATLDPRDAEKAGGP